MLGSSPIPNLATPTIPRFSWGSLGSFSLQVEASPLILLVLTMLVGIFVAAVTVMLIYHWRRFPFEQEVFKMAERIYLAGVTLLLAVAVVGILLT